MVLIQIKGGATSQPEILGGPASFGPRLAPNTIHISGPLSIADPMNACSPPTNKASVANHVAFVRRGDCTFIEKVRQMQAAGAVAVLVLDNQNPAPDARPLTMTGDGNDDITIPAAYLNLRDGSALLHDIRRGGVIRASLSGRVGWILWDGGLPLPSRP